MRRTVRNLVILGIISVLSTSVSGQGKGKGGGGNDGGGEPTVEPAIEYQLKLDPVPEAPNSFSGLNEVGQFVGYFSDYAEAGSRTPILYDATTGKLTYINDLLDLSTLPAGWRFAAALDINDHGVLVGYAIDDLGAYRACAVDLAQVNPGVDILPTVSGTESTGLKINNAGLILGVENASQSAVSSSWDLCWTLDTQLYGDPEDRITRTSSGLDLRAANPNIVPVVSSHGLSCDLSESSDTGMAWVGGIEDGGAPFKHLVGTPLIESFNDLSYRSGNFGGINASGDFAGTAWVVTGQKAKKDVYESIAYRYESARSDYLTVTTEDVTAQDINNFGEIAFSISPYGGIGVFRDWNDGVGERYLPIDNLIVGNNADLEIWFSSTPFGFSMNDAGMVVGRITQDATGIPYLFTLVPVATNP